MSFDVIMLTKISAEIQEHLRAQYNLVGVITRLDWFNTGYILI